MCIEENPNLILPYAVAAAEEDCESELMLRMKKCRKPTVARKASTNKATKKGESKSGKSNATKQGGIAQKTTQSKEKQPVAEPKAPPAKTTTKPLAGRKRTYKKSAAML